MNRQLKEYAEEAGYPDYMTYGQDKVLERFAELIIVKCANIIWAEADMKDSAEINQGGYKILEHFGIDWRTK
jgi:hypothetical protein